MSKEIYIVMTRLAPYCLFAFFIINSGLLKGQQTSEKRTEIDSLEYLLTTDLVDTKRLEVLKELSFTKSKSNMFNYDTNEDSLHVEKYIDEGIDLAEDLNNDHDVAELKLCRVWFYINMYRDYEKGRELCEQVLSQARESGPPYVLSEALRLKGYLEKANDWDNVFGYFEQALEVCEQSDDLLDQRVVILCDMGDYKAERYYDEESLPYFESAWELAQRSNGPINIYPLISIAVSLMNESQDSKADSILQKCLEIAKENNNHEYISKAYKAMASLNTNYYNTNSKKGIELLRLAELYSSREDRINILYNLAKAYSRSGLEEGQDSANYFYGQALAISRNLPWVDSKIYLYNSYSLYLVKQHLPDSAVSFFDKAKRSISYFLSPEDEAETTRLFANYLNAMGNSKLALVQLKKSLNLLDDSKNYQVIGQVNHSMSSMYHNIQDERQALKFQKAATAAYQKQDNRSGYAAALATEGLYYKELDNLDSAILMYQKALEVSQTEKKVCLEGSIYKSMVSLWIKMGELDSALSALKNSKRYIKDCSPVYELKVLWQEVNYYDALGDHDRTIMSFEKVMNIKNKNNIVLLPGTEVDLYRDIHKSYKEIGDYINAYQYLSKYHGLYDSLIGQEQKREVVEKEIEYKNEKEKQERALAEAEEKARQAQKDQRLMWIMYSAFAFIIVLSLFLGLVYIYYRKKQRVNKILKQQNEQINQQKEELQELDTFKSHFFANISHELRTPLTLISGPLESLLDKSAEGDANHELQLALRNTKKLKVLVNDILELSKLEKAKINLHETPVEIKGLLNRLCGNYTSMAEQLKIDYQVSMQDLEAHWLLLDEKRMEKIINNLLFNAIKYTSPGGKIELKAKRQRDMLIIEVSDTGQGIAEKDLPHIFERYFQSKQPDAPIQGGTGIGLALAHELAHLMNGELSVQSELHKGSTFTLKLPLKETAPVDGATLEEDGINVSADSTQKPEVFPVGVRDKAMSILVVEDNNDMRSYITGLIQKDYTTFSAINGREALEVLKKESIDLIITDAMMPVMDGYALIKHLKESDEHRLKPIIMLTALKMEGKKVEALSLGVDDYLTKPFSTEELKARVQNLLARYEERKKWSKEMSQESPSPEASSSEEGSVLILNKEEIGVHSQKWLKKVEDIIRRELLNNEFNITDLADEFHLSERQFHRKFKTLAGLTPKQFQIEVVLQEARELLEQDVYGNVSAVAYSVGMQNVSRFSKLYESRFGKKPKAYFE